MARLGLPDWVSQNSFQKLKTWTTFSLSLYFFLILFLPLNIFLFLFLSLYLYVSVRGNEVFIKQRKILFLIECFEGNHKLIFVVFSFIFANKTTDFYPGSDQGGNKISLEIKQVISQSSMVIKNIFTWICQNFNAYETFCTKLSFCLICLQQTVNKFDFNMLIYIKYYPTLCVK